MPDQFIEDVYLVSFSTGEAKQGPLLAAAHSHREIPTTHKICNHGSYYILVFPFVWPSVVFSPIPVSNSPPLPNHHNRQRQRQRQHQPHPLLLLRTQKLQHNRAHPRNINSRKFLGIQPCTETISGTPWTNKTQHSYAHYQAWSFSLAPSYPPPQKKYFI